jgi:hypothetical protein
VVAEYFINAGSTIQQGIELSVKATVIKNHRGIFTNLSIWGSTKVPNLIISSIINRVIPDYAGKMLTGVPQEYLSYGS